MAPAWATPGPRSPARGCVNLIVNAQQAMEKGEAFKKVLTIRTSVNQAGRSCSTSATPAPASPRRCVTASSSPSSPPNRARAPAGPGSACPSRRELSRPRLPQRLGFRFLAVERRLDRGDVDLPHRHHRVHRPLGAARSGSAISVEQPLRRDLPGQAPAVLEPAALALLAAIGDRRPNSGRSRPGPRSGP